MEAGVDLGKPTIWGLLDDSYRFDAPNGQHRDISSAPRETSGEGRYGSWHTLVVGGPRVTACDALACRAAALGIARRSQHAGFLNLVLKIGARDRTLNCLTLL